MTLDIRIAIDAMGGKDSPNKVLNGISLFAGDPVQESFQQFQAPVFLTECTP